jgi:hypothetical protein
VEKLVRTLLVVHLVSRLLSSGQDVISMGNLMGNKCHHCTVRGTLEVASKFKRCRDHSKRCRDYSWIREERIVH